MLFSAGGPEIFELVAPPTNLSVRRWESLRFFSIFAICSPRGRSFRPNFFPEPIRFHAAAQGHAGAMEHHPKIVFGNVEHGANLPALDAVNFPQSECRPDVFWQLVRAITKGLPKNLTVQA